jgi:hypothetical protein
MAVQRVVSFVSILTNCQTNCQEVAMTHNLVASDRVERASVCGHDGSRLGLIERLMIDKESGKVAYAVVRCGEPFSGASRHCPLEWTALRYNPGFKAFEIDLTLDELRARAASEGETFDWGERSAEYRHPNYWAV